MRCGFVTKSSNDSLSDVSSTASGAGLREGSTLFSRSAPCLRRASSSLKNSRSKAFSARRAPRNVQIRGRHLLYPPASSGGDSSRPTRRSGGCRTRPWPLPKNRAFSRPSWGAPRRQGSTRAVYQTFGERFQGGFIQGLGQGSSEVAARVPGRIRGEHGVRREHDIGGTAAMEASRLASDAHGINDWARLATTIEASSWQGSSSSLVMNF